MVEVLSSLQTSEISSFMYPIGKKYLLGMIKEHNRYLGRLTISNKAFELHSGNSQPRVNNIDIQDAKV